jgi:uncharacterized protein
VKREQSVTFPSDGLDLRGVLRHPRDLHRGERRAAFLVLHGFGTHKGTSNAVAPARLLADWGYVTMRFDMRGCGESDGERGRILCHDQVRDTQHALEFLVGRPEILGDRIAAIGSSFGGAVAVYTGGVDERLAAVISCGGWGDGASKFRAQHPTASAWARFEAMLEEGEQHRERTGTSLWVDRYDIVPIPEELRGNLPDGVHARFPVETVRSMYDFRAEDVVGCIAPRPLLLLHPAADSVTPTEQSIRLFQRAGQPTDLHLLSDVDHFMFSRRNRNVRDILRHWLHERFPAK